MYIVLDTNVLVSSLINPFGTPAKILNLVLNERIHLLFDTRIMNEYKEVLLRKKFNFTSQIVNDLLEFIKHNGTNIIVDPLSIDFKDPDDLPFYEVAISGKANYLITGNLAHFPLNNKQVEIVDPGKFIKLYT